MTVQFDDGSEVTVGPGDVVVLEPGHDAWTVGDEACVMLDTGVRVVREAFLIGGPGKPLPNRRGGSIPRMAESPRDGVRRSRGAPRG